MGPTREKFYFLAPTTEIPVDGPMFLGAIITDPREADAPLNDHSYLIDSKNMPIYDDEILDYSVRLEKSRSGMLGIFCTFLAQILGIGLDAEGERAKSDNETWTCKKLKTIWFNPSPAYIKESLEKSEVKEFLTENPNWLGESKVYMITGLKLAYGASGIMSYAKSRGLNLRLGFDATSLGVPIQLGPTGGYSTEDKVEQDFRDKSPFVLAFRMRQIKISSSGKVGTKSVTGGMLGLQNDDDASKGPQASFNVDGLEDADAGAEDFELEALQGVADFTSSGEEACGCSIVES